MNGTVTHQWTIVYDASHRGYVKDKLSNKTFCPPHLETLKDVATKIGETHVYRTEFYYHANFHADRREISVPGQKNTYFRLYGTPIATVPCYRAYIFRNFSSSCFKL